MFPIYHLLLFKLKPWGSTHKKKVKGEKEKEVSELESIISELVKNKEIDGIVTGVIESNYQRERIQKLQTAMDYYISRRFGKQILKNTWSHLLRKGLR